MSFSAPIDYDDDEHDYDLEQQMAQEAVEDDDGEPAEDDGEPADDDGEAVAEEDDEEYGEMDDEDDEDDEKEADEEADEEDDEEDDEEPDEEDEDEDMLGSLEYGGYTEQVEGKKERKKEVKKVRGRRIVNDDDDDDDDEVDSVNNKAGAGADDQDDGRSDSGLSGIFGDTEGEHERNYSAFNERIMRIDESAKPFLMERDELWKCISEFPQDSMIPKRAMRVLVPADFFRRDAEFFRQWQLPKGNESRCRATAALVSLLFAGMQMGFVSGKHEEQKRAQAQNEEAAAAASEESGQGKKTRSVPLTRVSRYTYCPESAESDSYPMFQIGVEDIYDADKSQVLALGVWLFIFDETHSTSEMVRRVMQNTRELKTAKQVSGASAASRSRDASAEADRHGKGGFGFQQVRDNFDATVGLQYLQVSTLDDWQNMLELHSGRSSVHEGKPCVSDLPSHINCPAGRRQLEGDNKTGCGGKHPLAPEFVFNAKRDESLSFGAVGVDGKPMNLCYEQLDSRSYWDNAKKSFRLPRFGVESFFWMCTSVEKRTIFELPLTRPLQGTTTPGDSLMRLFVEHEIYTKNVAANRENAFIDPNRIVIDKGAINRFRSVATGRDEHMRRQDLLLRNTLLSYDLMTSAAGAALNGGDVSFDPDASGDEANYVIRTTSMTRRVAAESDRIYSKVVQPWISRTEKFLRSVANPLQRAGIPYSDSRWASYWHMRESYHARLYLVKKDLTQYHLRLLRTCFLSSKDSATLPAGYKAMFEGLEEGLRAHGGSASIAFNGGKDGTGRQLMNKDRQIWGSLQEWLRYVFVDCCKISGRDRRLMDEIYLHIFEMYIQTTFVLIIASEKGKGKSVRAMRMGSILPPGWVSYNSATSSRSGMNGNNSASNGTTVVCDEIIADLLPADATERMEFYKTIVGKRQFEIERTRCVKSTDGTESHMTFKIITEHWETFLICCNLGQCITINGDPSSGKEALIQRTVCMQARSEADSDSPEHEFQANLKHPEVAPTISDFRMFTSLCGFVRMSMMGIDWLQPDFAIANLIFKEGDRILVEEYNKPRPEPRRLVKRLNNLTTMCVHEAVARVFMFKQSACNYEAGKPDRNGRGKQFEIGDLWDVLRTLRPTREMIIAAWSHSLEYSIGTSSHGTNVMTGICEKLGFLIDQIFMQLPEKSAEQLADPNGTPFELESYMSEVRQNVAGGLSTGSDGLGARKSTLATYEKRLRDSRILRNDFRRKCQDSSHSQRPLQSIAAVVGAGKAVKYADALFPTIVAASMYYKPQTLLQWAVGRRVTAVEVFQTRNEKMKYKERQSAGGAKVFDFGWLVLHSSGSPGSSTWSSVTKDGMIHAATVRLFDMHVAGVADAMFMLASTENSMLLSEEPGLPWSFRSSDALVDENGNAPSKHDSCELGPRPVTLIGHNDPMPAHEGQAVESRVVGSLTHSSSCLLHKQLDNLHQNCRLPQLQPHTSTKVTKGPPIRRTGGTVEVNSVAAFEHVHMLMEAILRCSRICGLKGLQENFQSGGLAPECLKAPNQELELDEETLLETVRKLPYAIDMMQMAWSIDLASRLYTPTRTEQVSAFNEMVAHEELGDKIGAESTPEVTLRYPGFPRTAHERHEALRLISIRPPTTRPANQKIIDIASASPMQDIDPELLRYETEVAIGGPASDADIEEHRRSLIGSGYVWGVTGDVFDYTTWASHLSASMIGRGNTDGKTCRVTGAYTDAAHNSAMDSEFMLQERLTERRSAKKTKGYTHLNITLPGGSTYTHLESNPVADVIPGQKRSRTSEAPVSRQNVRSQMLKVYKQPAPAPTRSDPPEIMLRNCDSRQD